ncbi:MAG TPA: FAD-dependent oxidoreductase [Pseudonocardiaceae bacterium]|nr:FAD-dependent oxidoreductase [Pseudonocardiaceae bacterium]
MAILVVGAGIAGVACARALLAGGADVRVVDRARMVGGRMATGQLGRPGRPVDLGAAYFTADDDGFAAVVAGWQARGLARPWTDTLTVFDDNGRHPAPGPMRWAAPGGLRSLVGDLADGLDITLEHPVTEVGPGPVVAGRGYAAVVLAMPDPQAARVLTPASPTRALLTGADEVTWAPVIAVAAEFPARTWPDFDAAFVNDHDTLSLLADDGARRGDHVPVLVAHTTATVARAHDANPDDTVPPALAAMRDLLGISADPVWTHAHHWRLAQPDRHRDAAFHLGADGIGLAGDVWGRPRVQTAWCSGTALATELLSRSIG